MTGRQMSARIFKIKRIFLPGKGIFAVILLFISLLPGRGLAERATVRVKAPELISGTFSFIITIDNAVDMDAGQFDLGFNPGVIKVTDVRSGSIGGANVPLVRWASVNEDKIRVLFNLPGVQGISGSGELARITARVAGKIGDSSNLNISGGLLVDKEAKSIPANWYGAMVRVETLAPESKNVSEPSAGEPKRPAATRGGISISTPMAVTALLGLVAIPTIALLLSRRKNG
jgi:hypothetical protein